MSEPTKDPSEKKLVKKRIVKKIIKKKKSDTSDTGEALVFESSTAKDEATREDTDAARKDAFPSGPVRRIITKKGIGRKFSRESLEEVIGKKLPVRKEPGELEQQRELVHEEEEVLPVKSDVKDDEEIKEEDSPSSFDGIDSARKVRRRVVKKRPAIKRVIKKKAVTRRLARETVEQVLGKKLAAESRDEGGGTSLTQKKEAPVVKRPGLVSKPSRGDVPVKREDGYPTKEIPQPKIMVPDVVIADNWKQKKISSYKKKPDAEPVFSLLPRETVLNEKYKVVECVHSDCYGFVYRVTDLKEKSGASFKAVKEIQYSLSEDVDKSRLEETMSRLKKMVSFLQDVEHPTLTRISDYFFDIDEAKGARFFIVMEFVEGKSLEDILQKYKKEGDFISAKIIFECMEKVCDALMYLHNKKPFPMAFGELNPSNIMISNNGEIKLINYGIARGVEGGIVSSEYTGRLGYSAPEKFGVDFTNTKADIFAFGVILYYLLTGINPEDKPYDFKRIKEIKPQISEKVEEFVFKCISIHPKDRPDIKEVKEIIKTLDFFELDTSTEEERKVEEKKKKLSTTKTKVIEPVEEILGEGSDEEDKGSILKKFSFLIPIILLLIVVFIIVMIFYK